MLAGSSNTLFEATEILTRSSLIPAVRLHSHILLPQQNTKDCLAYTIGLYLLI